MQLKSISFRKLMVLFWLLAKRKGTLHPPPASRVPSEGGDVKIFTSFFLHKLDNRVRTFSHRNIEISLPFFRDVSRRNWIYIWFSSITKSSCLNKTSSMLPHRSTIQSEGLWKCNNVAHRWRQSKIRAGKSCEKHERKIRRWKSRENEREAREGQTIIHHNAAA